MTTYMEKQPQPIRRLTVECIILQSIRLEDALLSSLQIAELAWRVRGIPDENPHCDVQRGAG